MKRETWSPQSCRYKVVWSWLKKEWTRRRNTRVQHKPLKNSSWKRNETCLPSELKNITCLLGHQVILSIHRGLVCRPITEDEYLVTVENRPIQLCERVFVFLLRQHDNTHFWLVVNWVSYLRWLLEEINWHCSPVVTILWGSYVNAALCLAK